MSEFPQSEESPESSAFDESGTELQDEGISVGLDDQGISEWRRLARALPPVRRDKFIVLSLLTLNMYHVVWHWRWWQAVKKHDDSDIWPLARAIFSPFFYFSLLDRLNVSERGFLGITYLLLPMLSRLPNAFGLVSLLAFVPVLPTVRTIDEAHTDREELDSSYGWRSRNLVLAIPGAFLLIFAVASVFMMPSVVVPGSEMTDDDIRYLRDADILFDDEQILYFYSLGAFSIHENGVFASNAGVTSYWKDPYLDTIETVFLPYEEIAALQINYSSHSFEDTAVRIESHSGASFLIFLSPDDGGDRLFIDEIERRREAAPSTLERDAI